MKVIIAGSRELGRPEVDAAMSACPWLASITEVVSGRCRGVDAAGEEWARERGIAVQTFPADWKTYGLAAGPIRNIEMASYADGLVAVGNTKGTANMIKAAKKKGLKISLYEAHS